MGRAVGYMVGGPSDYTVISWKWDSISLPISIPIPSPITRSLAIMRTHGYGSGLSSRHGVTSTSARRLQIMVQAFTHVDCHANLVKQMDWTLIHSNKQSSKRSWSWFNTQFFGIKMKFMKDSKCHHKTSVSGFENVHSSNQKPDWWPKYLCTDSVDMLVWFIKWWNLRCCHYTGDTRLSDYQGPQPS